MDTGYGTITFNKKIVDNIGAISKFSGVEELGAIICKLNDNAIQIIAPEKKLKQAVLLVKEDLEKLHYKALKSDIPGVIETIGEVIKNILDEKNII